MFLSNFSTDPDFSKKKFLDLVPGKVESKFLKFSFDCTFLRYTAEIGLYEDGLRHKTRID